MERKVDYLTFQTGGKMTVPFECFLIFSTNLNPDQLGDEAFLRRIQYKMMLKSPSENEFREIFHRFCKQKELPCTPEVYDTYIELHYRRTGKRMRRCHPRDVLTHAIDLIKFERLAYELSDEVLHHAFESCFLTIDHRQD
jgi:SpoVK/Ycf46/Vps4 family AAA+-type ATPase